MCILLRFFGIVVYLVLKSIFRLYGVEFFYRYLEGVKGFFFSLIAGFRGYYVYCRN